MIFPSWLSRSSDPFIRSKLFDETTFYKAFISDLKKCKKEEKKPLNFASIEMQKAPRNYVKWIVVLASIILILVIYFKVK